jgi:ComF family protein
MTALPELLDVPKSIAGVVSCADYSRGVEMISGAMQIAKEVRDGLLALVFPVRCCLCDEFGAEYLCSACAATMPKPVPEPICVRCGRHRESLPCSECLGDPPYFACAMAVGEYAGNLQEAIHWFKYRDRPMLAEPLGLILSAHARRNRAALAGLMFDAIVPAPLHSARERLRGYNQAERLARVVGRELGIRVRTDLIRRVKHTRPQVGLDGDERRGNLDGAFEANESVVKGLAILLIDDVSTTGTTFRECAKVLKKGGAKAVYCLGLATG